MTLLSSREDGGLTLCLLWSASTMMAGVLAWVLLVRFGADPETQSSLLPINGAVAGGLVGVGQWLVLSRASASSWPWVPATSLGLAVGVGLVMEALELMQRVQSRYLGSMIFLGILLGPTALGQYFCLRTAIPHSWIWPLSVLSSGATALGVVLAIAGLSSLLHLQVSDDAALALWILSLSCFSSIPVGYWFRANSVSKRSSPRDL